MSAPNYAWDGYADSKGVPNCYIEPAFDNPRRIHTPSDDRGPRPTNSPPARSPEQTLAAEVLLKAWNDATGRGFVHDSSKVAKALRTEAWAFLTAEMPDPRAARRQLFTALLGLDDDSFRAAAVRKLGQCPSLRPEFDPLRAKKGQLMWVPPARAVVKPRTNPKPKPAPKPEKKPKQERAPAPTRKPTPPTRYKFYQSLLGPLLAEARQRRDTKRPPIPIDNTVLRHVGDRQNELPPTDPHPCSEGTRIAQVLELLKEHPDGLTISELHERLPTFSRTRITNSVFYLRRSLCQPIVMKHNRYRLLPRAEWVAETNSPTTGT